MARCEHWHRDLLRDICIDCGKSGFSIEIERKREELELLLIRDRFQALDGHDPYNHRGSKTYAGERR